MDLHRLAVLGHERADDLAGARQITDPRRRRSGVRLVGGRDAASPFVRDDGQHRVVLVHSVLKLDDLGRLGAARQVGVGVVLRDALQLAAERTAGAEQHQPRDQDEPFRTAAGGKPCQSAAHVRSSSLFPRRYYAFSSRVKTCREFVVVHRARTGVAMISGGRLGSGSCMQRSV
jgi:hypothetical protein